MKMEEKRIIPQKISIKTKPQGQRNQLFITVDSDEQNFSAFVTRELCSIIIGFLEKQEAMICDFDGERLICVKNRMLTESKQSSVSNLIPDYEAIPLGLTLYSTRLGINFYAYLRIGKLSLAGFVSSVWVDRVVDAILTQSPLLFRTEEDKRPNVLKLTSGVLPISSASAKLDHIAYFNQ